MTELLRKILTNIHPGVQIGNACWELFCLGARYPAWWTDAKRQDDWRPRIGIQKRFPRIKSKIRWGKITKLSLQVTGLSSLCRDFLMRNSYCSTFHVFVCSWSQSFRLLAWWRRRWCFQHVAGLWRVFFLLFPPNAAEFCWDCEMKYIYIYIYCALLKTCCRIGCRNHHSRHRAMIVCDTCTQRSAIVFLTPGQLAGHMHTPRLHFKEHMHTEKTPFQHQIWPKNGVNFRTYNLFPSLLRAGFGGRWLVCETGPRSSAFFLLLPYHLGLNIWSAWPQLQRFSVCQTGFTTKTSTCSRYPCAIIIICAQYSYYDYKHTHTVRARSHEARNACFWEPKNRLADRSFAHS